MKIFSIKSSLAYGLTHRMKTLDAQKVIDAVGSGFKPSKAIGRNLVVVEKINTANKVFVEAVEETEKKKRVIFDEVKAKFEEAKKGNLSKEAEAKASRDFQAEFNEKSAEIQKESTAKPDEMVEVALGDDDYTEVLLEVFEKTAQTWDVDGSGKGQELFVEVADAINSAKDA